MFVLISKGFVIQKQVKINAGKIELENGVMTTPKRHSILPALIFTCFCKMFVARGILKERKTKMA